jgi:hypothetical protein
MPLPRYVEALDLRRLPWFRPVDASLTVRIGFRADGGTTEVQQANVKVDKPLLNERPA